MFLIASAGFHGNVETPLDEDLVDSKLPRGTKFIQAEVPVVKLKMLTWAARKNMIAEKSATKKAAKRKQPEI